MVKTVDNPIKKGDIVVVTQRYLFYTRLSFRRMPAGHKAGIQVWKKYDLSKGDKKIVKIGKVLRVNRLTYTVEMRGDCNPYTQAEFLIPKKDVRLSLEQSINRV